MTTSCRAQAASDNLRSGRHPSVEADNDRWKAIQHALECQAKKPSAQQGHDSILDAQFDVGNLERRSAALLLPCGSQKTLSNSASQPTGKCGTSLDILAAIDDEMRDLDFLQQQLCSDEVEPADPAWGQLWMAGSFTPSMAQERNVPEHLSATRRNSHSSAESGGYACSDSITLGPTAPKGIVHMPSGRHLCVKASTGSPQIMAPTQQQSARADTSLRAVLQAANASATVPNVSDGCEMNPAATIAMPFTAEDEWQDISDHSGRSVPEAHAALQRIASALQVRAGQLKGHDHAHAAWAMR
jgi:hypothetical protein